MKTSILSLLFILISSSSFAQSPDSLFYSIDSLLSVESEKPFNGVILVEKDVKVVYSKTQGLSDLEIKTPLDIEDQFVIGSISKQFTAAIILREYEEGRLKLHLPIREYLPELTESWADTVTVHHLLTHTHGIVALDKPTIFPVGTQYNYSQIGYDLLAKISEKTSGKSFQEISAELFRKCGMKNTTHPSLKSNSGALVKGYVENERKTLEPTTDGFAIYPAAGSFISTVNDLALWNKCLFEGSILKDSTLQLMTSAQDKAVRDHPVFGITKYGYGITVDNGDEIIQWGQTGLVPGFVSMNFYFPQYKLSVIVLSNVDYENHGLKDAFYYHTQILNIVRRNLSILDD